MSKAKVFDASCDIVVVGYGFAGAAAAIEAADRGAKVLLLEKMPDPGGISITSGGSARCSLSAEDAFSYLKVTNAGTTPDPVLRVLADGMATMQQYVEKLANEVGRNVVNTEHAGRKGGNYPFPGWETFYHAMIEEWPDFDQQRTYPQVRARPGAPGPRLFKVIEDNVAMRGIDVRLETAAERLITDANGEVIGLTVRTKDGIRAIRARRAVVLASGGFEANEEMKRQYWSGKPILTAASRGNTGDGIKMAQMVGAALWHMWHYHGSYAYKHPDPEFPYGLRVKRLPDWNPVLKETMDVKMVWIVVDQNGCRFMNECPPYTQDTSARPMEHYDPETMSYPRIPSYLICDERGRKTYPLGDARTNDREFLYDWSEDNSREIELGIFRRFDTLAGIAERIGVSSARIEATVGRWNELCLAGRDDDFGRPGGTMTPIVTPPYYVAEVWPVVSNTQGGPVHNERQQILNPYDEPIPRLFAAGELGSSFGHLYLSGGNISECFVTGQVAGREAAALALSDTDAVG